MTDREKPDQTPPVDEETLDTLQQTLYTRLREPLLMEIRESLLQAATEQPIPLYYDRFVTSETRRLQ
ncbi:MAG: hypothetical protein ACE5HA_14150, partial [Anaerolineae bacterium]